MALTEDRRKLYRNLAFGVAALVLVVAYFTTSGGGAKSACKDVGESLAASLHLVEDYGNAPERSLRDSAVASLAETADKAEGERSLEAPYGDVMSQIYRASNTAGQALGTGVISSAAAGQLRTASDSWQATCGPLLK